jgi:hypothetical protein
VSPASLALTGNRSHRNSIWHLVVPITVLTLVIGMTLGEFWHRHVNTAPETCPICHLSHQAVEPAVPGVRAEILIPEGPAPEPQEVASVQRFVAAELPARAPPA